MIVWGGGGGVLKSGVPLEHMYTNVESFVNEPECSRLFVWMCP